MILRDKIAPATDENESLQKQGSNTPFPSFTRVRCEGNDYFAIIGMLSYLGTLLVHGGLRRRNPGVL